MDDESAVVKCGSGTAAQVERFAARAFLLGGQWVDGEQKAADPWETDPLDLLLRMVGPWAVDLTDHGVAPATAVMLFLEADGHTVPLPARIARNQRQEQATIAYARACATYVAWASGERWDDAFLFAVALAIALPKEALDGIASTWSPEEIAYNFVVDEFLVHRRLRMLRGGHDSGERPAISTAR